MMQTPEFENDLKKHIANKFCHCKGIQEITSLADYTLIMYLSPHVNIECIAKLRDILKSDLQF